MRFSVHTGSLTSDPASLCPLLQQDQNTPIIGQGCTNLAASSADRKRHVTCAPRGPASPICPSLSFWYTHVKSASELRADPDHFPHINNGAQPFFLISACADDPRLLLRESP